MNNSTKLDVFAYHVYNDAVQKGKRYFLKSTVESQEKDTATLVKKLVNKIEKIEKTAV